MATHIGGRKKSVLFECPHDSRVTLVMAHMLEHQPTATQPPSHCSPILPSPFIVNEASRS